MRRTATPMTWPSFEDESLSVSTVAIGQSVTLAGTTWTLRFCAVKDMEATARTVSVERWWVDSADLGGVSFLSG